MVGVVQADMHISLHVLKTRKAKTEVAVVPPTYLAALGSGALHERELVSSARPVRPVTKANRIK